MVSWLIGCSPTPSSPASAGAPTSAPSGSAAAPSGTAATATGTAAAPTGTPGGGCPVAEQSGVLRSNRLLDMTIGSDALSDRITFQLGEPAPEPLGSTGRLRAVVPPFSQGGSGLPVKVEGTRFVEVRLDGMLLAGEDGSPTYTGPTSVKPGLIALRQVEMTEAFEGVYVFVVGYDGSGCVSLLDDAVARTLTLTIGR